MATTTTTQNGYTNGINGHATSPSFLRFSTIPDAIDIPVRGDDGDEAVNLDLTELLDETDELCDLLENENAARTYWITIALAYAKQNKVDIAIDILQKGLQAFSRGGGSGRSEDRLSILTCLCWFYLYKCRRAARVKPTQGEEDTRTKEQFLHLATQTLNDASRLSPSYPPLFLARGTLYLLRASLQPSKAVGHTDERSETLKQAAKNFDDAYRVSNSKNIFALMGKAKAQFSLGNYSNALQFYQSALERAPDVLDPDPRIGIGCCLWQLGHKAAAKSAWQRSLDLNSETNTIAHILLGLSYLDQAYQHPTTSPDFAPLYKQAMQTHTQTAFKLNSMHPLTCSTFGSYFLLRKTWPNVERLARRAIEHTDVNAVASDGWYLLARKAHWEQDWDAAQDAYTKADQARGGDERGYLPAKFGAAQVRVQRRDGDGAKWRLEKLVEQAGRGGAAGGVGEAVALLGVLFAEDVFAAQAQGSKEDKSNEAKRAIALLEQVRVNWRDPKKQQKSTPENAVPVLLNLARLYEHEAPEKTLACLLQVEQIELESISDDDLPDEMGQDEVEERRLRRELLPPQLLNNIGCFHFQASQYTEAREDFQTALNACVKLGNGQSEDGAEAMDTDALVSTISYNLARTYEAEGIDDEARKVYAGLLERHPEYIDARTRLAYLAYKPSDANDGGEAIKALLDSDSANLEVRALYGWYINRTKKRTSQLNEDAEQRHYKHTLQTYDKHDLYALTGMGNLHLAVAREMPRSTDIEREKRGKMYMRAVEFFDKVLTLDPRNAFAAQGLGIAVVEEKRDSASGIQIFSKVRESLRGEAGSGTTSVYVNLGHVFAEVKQFSRAVENYEVALAKCSDDQTRERILQYLGRVWLMRGRQEKKLEAYKTSLDFARQALESTGSDKDNVNARFNVAFVQIQLAQMINSLPESQKTLQDVEQASEGLDEAIEAFLEISKLPNPPFPRGDIEQRANMGRNTMKRQMAAAIERQAEYEQKNASRLEEARRKREEDIARREAQKKAAEDAAAEDRRKITEERKRMAEEDRLLVLQKLEEEKAKEEAEWTTDEETGERRKREKKPKAKGGKRKKKEEDDIIDDGTDVEGRKSRPRSGVTSATGSDGEPRRKKKRKLESRKGRATSNKYKSADIVEESSEEEGANVPTDTQDVDQEVLGTGDVSNGQLGLEEPMFSDDEEEAPAVSRASQRKKVARILDDEDDDEIDVAGNGVTEAGGSEHGSD